MYVIVMATRNIPGPESDSHKRDCEERPGPHVPSEGYSASLHRVTVCVKNSYK